MSRTIYLLLNLTIILLGLLCFEYSLAQSSQSEYQKLLEHSNVLFPIINVAVVSAAKTFAVMVGVIFFLSSLIVGWWWHRHNKKHDATDKVLLAILDNQKHHTEVMKACPSCSSAAKKVVEGREAFDELSPDINGPEVLGDRLGGMPI